MNAPRNLVVLGRDASATVIEEQLSADFEGVSFHLGGTEAVVGDQAKLVFGTTQEWGRNVYHYSNQRARVGREADAVAVIDDALAGCVPDAPLLELRDRLASGQEVPFDVVTRARDGAEEAFLTLADALNTSDSDRVGLLHARIAAHIRPDLIEADLLAAEILEDEGQHALATEALASVPAGSPWYVTAQIRRATRPMIS